MKRTYTRLIIVATLWAVLTGAYRYPPGQKDINRGIFESEIAEKLTRGVTNTVWGWTEAVITPVDMAEDPHHNVVSAVFLGIHYGLVRAVGRTLVGVYEIATCYAPQKPIFKPIEGEVL